MVRMPFTVSGMVCAFPFACPPNNHLAPQSVFTKCKTSLTDGRRLENISWRLWYREVCSHAISSGSSSPESESEFHSQSPITPVSEDGPSDRRGINAL